MHRRPTPPAPTKKSNDLKPAISPGIGIIRSFVSKENIHAMNHRFTVIAFVAALLPGCASVYYDTLEAVGIPKRDLLVSRIERARDSQEDAKQQFQSALEQFSATVGFDGGDLEALYKRLNREYELSESRAEQVHDRIDEVESVAGALFREWQDELEQISNASLRQQSRSQLEDTRSQYSGLMSAMRRAESRIEPVLVTFRDQVLFLKHNLNARAIASLGTQLTAIESDVSRLIQDMENAIREATDFINQMQAG